VRARLFERPYRLLALGPVVAILGAPWMADRIEPRILGLPFLLAWVAGSVLASSLVMWLIRTLDRRHDAQARAAATDA
jgi:hypothetical protein